MDIASALRRMMNRVPRYSGYFDWHDKSRKELGVVESLVSSMHERGDFRYRNPRSSSEDWPDCYVDSAQGGEVSVEVTELVDPDAVRVNRQQQHCPEQQVYRAWEPHEVLAEIDRILRHKDLRCCALGTIALVIHTDEPELLWSEYKDLLASTAFSSCERIDVAFLLFSYDPAEKGCPYVELQLGAE